MKGDDSQVQGGDDSPSSSSFWGTLVEASDALLGITTAAITSLMPAPANHQSTRVEDMSLLDPAGAARGDTSSTQTQDSETLPHRSSSPSVPPSLATAAAAHPYSTAFLLGATLTGSILAGSMAARYAAGRVGTRAAGSDGCGHGRRRGMVSAGQFRATNGQNVSVTDLEFDKRLVRIEDLLRESQTRQKLWSDQMTATVPRLVPRLSKIEDTLAAEVQCRKANAIEQLKMSKSLEARIGDLESTFRTDIDKGRQSQKAMAHSLSSKMRSDMAILLDRLDRMEQDLNTVSSHFAPPRSIGKQAVDRSEKTETASTLSSLNDLANEGINSVYKNAKGLLSEAYNSAKGTLMPEAPIFPERRTDAHPESVHSSSTSNGAVQKDLSKPATEDLGPAKAVAMEGPPSRTEAAWPEVEKTPQVERSQSTKETTVELPPEPRSKLPAAKSEQPIFLGVNDTGDWTFRLRGSYKVTSPAGMPQHSILITVCQRSRVSRGSPYRNEQATIFTVGPFTTAAVITSDLDMVLLDGAWWRCSRDNDLYTVREKVAVAQ